MLSDEEAKSIEDSCRTEADVHPPLLKRWIYALLSDRRERIQQTHYIRQRVDQAFRYLSTLFDQHREGNKEAKGNARRARNS